MSEQPQSRSWHKVASPAAATFLVSAEGRRFLRPFLEQEASVAQAAAVLGESLESTYYRVKRMLLLGIVEVTREESRAGRPVKYYRSVGDGIFVPFSLTSAADLEESRRHTNAEMDRLLVHGQTTAVQSAIDASDNWGYRIFRDASGASHFDYAPEAAPDDFDLQRLQVQAASPAVLSTWVQMPLEREDAKELQRELVELLARYRERSAEVEPSAASYLVHVGMGPVPDQAS